MLKPTKNNDDKNKIVHGIAWLITLSWANRILGFFSIIILARLLSPEDFGVMAIIVISIQLTETLSNIGSEQYFIQKNNANNDDLNCAWTSNLIIKTSASVLFAVIAPIIATFFHYQHIIPALLSISLLPFITALSNGNIIKLKKELNYKKFVFIATLAKLMANVSAMAAAVYLANYWALVIGALLNSLLYSLFSYLFIKQRAHWGLENWQQQFQFSKWIILKGLIGHIRAKFDVWYASTIQGISALGGYNFAKDLALLPSRELLSPISEVFFTAIAKSENNSNEQKLKIRKAITIIYIIALPIAFGWTIIAEPFTQVVLGDKWLPYIPTLAVLGFLVITFAVGNFISQVMTATGKVRALFYYDLFTLALSLIMLLSVSSLVHSIETLALTRVLIGLTILLIGFLWLHFYKIISIQKIIKPAFYPLFISTLLVYCVERLFAFIHNPIIFLLITIVTSVLFYLSAILVGCKYNLLGKIESKFVLDLFRQNGKTIYIRLCHSKKHI